jgi:hypothetical protein
MVLKVTDLGEHFLHVIDFCSNFSHLIPHFFLPFAHFFDGSCNILYHNFDFRALFFYICLHHLCLRLYFLQKLFSSVELSGQCLFVCLVGGESGWFEVRK